MAHEYKITHSELSKTELVKILESQENYHGFVLLEGAGRFIYRLPSNTGEVPNAEVRIYQDGLYFCNYGGASDIMKYLVTSLESIGSVSVSELE